MKRTLLVTGFGPFPGAPSNPTMYMVRALRRLRHRLPKGVRLRTAILTTEWGKAREELALLGRMHRPDVAIHFGVSGKAEAITLETLARDALSADREDAAGVIHEASSIVGDGVNVPTRLPIDAMEAALRRAGIPVTRSDDAGGYLCNYVFALSARGLVDGFAPAVTGFVHVPHAREALPKGAKNPGLPRRVLTRAAIVAITAVLSA